MKLNQGKECRTRLLDWVVLFDMVTLSRYKLEGRSELRRAVEEEHSYKSRDLQGTMRRLQCGWSIGTREEKFGHEVREGQRTTLVR